MDAELVELARRLRDARKARGMSRAEAAKAAGISRSSLSMYERAKQEPLATMAKRLAVTYGVSADWIAGLSSEA